MSLSRIEAEAQKLLQERLHFLRQLHPSATAADTISAGVTSSAAPAPVPGAERRDSAGAERLRELEAIEEALQRIVEGSYGTCIACGGPLGLQRIRAIPEARYCLSCSGHRPGD